MHISKDKTDFFQIDKSGSHGKKIYCNPKLKLKTFLT